MKNFNSDTYVVDEIMVDTLQWLLLHQDCYDRFEYDALTKELFVHHANGIDRIKKGDYLNASYGILITSL